MFGTGREVVGPEIAISCQWFASRTLPSKSGTVTGVPAVPVYVRPFATIVA
jgi:hypothetical protein